MKTKRKKKRKMTHHGCKTQPLVPNKHPLLQKKKEKDVDVLGFPESF